MGTVYLGEHTLLGRKAAIKVLLPALSSNEEIVKRFFNEARAVTLISDPGIVQIFDFGYHADGSAFIVMELLDGEPMDKRLERVGRFGVVDCLRLMRLICASLAAAHARGIVHRDLKPENIFIVRDTAVAGGERAKILDFGIAKLSVDEPGTLKTRTGVLMGTPVYMSPEQCRGMGDIDHRSDIYTIGCVMFTMLTGGPPFLAESGGELIACHLREPAPLAVSRVPELPAMLDQILQRCLCKSPAERFQSMVELGDAMGAVEQAIHPGSTWPPSGSSRSTPMPAIRPSGLSGSPVTTLNGAIGQISAPGPAKTSSARTIAAVAGTLVIGGAIALVAINRAPPGPTITPAITPTITPATPAAMIAPAATITPDALPPNATLPDAAAVVTAPPIDAGTADAAAVAPVTPAPVTHRKSSRGREHARPNSSATQPDINRGD